MGVSRIRRFVAHLSLGCALSVALAACAPVESSDSPSAAAAPAASSATEQESALGCEEARFLKLINLYRAGAGLRALVVSRSATSAAKWHAEDMGAKGYFSHTDSLGRSPYTRAAAFGFQYCAGENAAAGNGAAEATFCQWKNSPPHNQNMLQSMFSSIGIGRAQVGGSQYGVYWSTPFGTGASDALAGTESICAMPSSLPGC